MLKHVRQLLFRLLTGANIATIVLMWGCAASVFLNPSEHSAAWSLPGLIFPFFAVVNFLFCIVWLLLSRRRLLLPLLGFLGCAGSLYTYCPVNFPSPQPKGSIRILSYNTMNFGDGALNPDGENAVAAYIRDSKADIVCLQEAGCLYKTWMEVQQMLSPIYPYMDRRNVGEDGNMLACFSRYPILSSEPLLYESRSNGSYLYHILLGKNDTILVINNHLESNRLSPDDRERYKKLIEAPEDAPVKQSSRLLATKVGRAGTVRAAQADSIAALIDRNVGHPLIVCGDLNDTPISYTRHTLADRLIDTYRATATGPGFSFNRDGILVRIDHLFCSEDWQAYGCRVDRSTKASDHYPITCCLKRKKP